MASTARATDVPLACSDRATTDLPHRIRSRGAATPARRLEQYASGGGTTRACAALERGGAARRLTLRNALDPARTLSAASPCAAMQCMPAARRAGKGFGGCVVSRALQHGPRRGRVVARSEVGLDVCRIMGPAMQGTLAACRAQRDFGGRVVLHPLQCGHGTSGVIAWRGARAPMRPKVERLADRGAPRCKGCLRLAASEETGVCVSPRIAWISVTGAAVASSARYASPQGRYSLQRRLKAATAAAASPEEGRTAAAP